MGHTAGMGRVWVVGSLNVDRGWQVARHPAVGETVLGEVLAPAPGGKGLNQAVAARRVGADVALVGQVGDDADGRWLVALAAGEGIDVSGITVTRDRPTGSALIVVAADGANTVTVAPGANATLAAGAAGPAPAATDVVVAQLEVPVEAVRAAFDLARAAGATAVLNPSPIGAGRALVPDVDVVVVNQAEAAELAGAPLAATTSEAMAQAEHLAGLARRPGQTVVVTLGEGGAVAVGPEGPIVVAGERVTAVDTTGAGDCFLGVLAAGLAEGRPLADVLLRANRAAALAVTRAGTVAAMPTAAELTGGAAGPPAS